MSERPKLHLVSYVLYYLLLFIAYWFGSHRFDFDGDGDFDPKDIEAYLTDKNHLHRNFKQTTTAKRKRAAHAQGEGPGGGSPVSSPDGSPVRVAEQPGEEEQIRQNLLEHQMLPWFILLECFLCLVLWFMGALVTARNTEGDLVFLLGGIDSFAERKTDLRLTSTECEDHRWEVWRWLTYQFTHVGLTHVLQNVFLNLMLGIPLEGMHGGARMGLMFNVGIFGGACCFFVNDAHNAVVGCSGGTYALIGMHIADLLMNWQQKHFRVPTIIFLASFIAMSIYSYVVTFGDTTSHSAHVGGLIAGMLIGVLVGKNLQVKIQERIFMVVALVIGGLLAASCIGWLIYNPVPLNIWEARNGEGGYCWTRQVYNKTINKNSWLCVRCGTQECMDFWGPQKATQVSPAFCDNIGYYYTER